MNKITVTNTAIIINNYEVGDCPNLERNFLIYDPIFHKTTPLGMYYDEENRRLYLPRGIDLYYVEKIVKESSLDYDVDIGREYPYKYHHIKNKIMMKYAPKDERQVETLKFALCLDQYAQNSNRAQFAINLNTGAGKTYCALGTIAYLGIRSIIITSQKGILDQWGDRISEYCDIDKSELVMLKGSDMLNRIYHGKSSLIGKSIYFITHSTIQSYASRYGWEAVGVIFEKLGIGVKIYDESHLDFINVSMIDFFTNVWRTYYLTATPSRSDKDENRIYKLYIKNVPSIELFDKENDPRTNYISIKFNSNPSPKDIIMCKHPIYRLNRIKYIDYLMNNDRFWIMFDYIFNLIYTSGGKALFYIGTNEGIQKAYDRILRCYPELADDVGIYTSIVDSGTKQLEKQKKYILSTTKSAGAGEDIKDLQYSVVLAEPFKSEVLTRQTLGRTRNRNTTYIELVDVAFSMLVSYYNAKKPIFSKYALSTKNIDVDNYRVVNLKNDNIKNHANRFNGCIRFNEPREAIQFVQNPTRECIIFTDTNMG